MKNIVIVATCTILFPLLLPVFPILFSNEWNQAKNNGY